MSFAQITSGNLLATLQRLPSVFRPLNRPPAEQQGLCRAGANGMSLNYLMVGGRGGTRTRGPLLAKQAQIQSKSLLRLRLLV